MRKWIAFLILAMCVPCFGQRKLTTNEATILAVGPFFDATDGVTPETAMDPNNMTIEIYREFDSGATPTRTAITPTGSNAMALVASSASGKYTLPLTAAQLNFTGYMEITIIDTDVMVPWFRSFIVTNANAVDSEYGNDYLYTEPLSINSVAAAQVVAVLMATDPSAEATADTIGLLFNKLRQMIDSLNRWTPDSLKNARHRGF